MPMGMLLPTTTITSVQQPETGIAPSDATEQEHEVTSASRSGQSLAIGISQHLDWPRSQTTRSSVLASNADPQLIEPPDTLSAYQVGTHDAIASIQDASDNSVTLQDLPNDDNNDSASAQPTGASLIVEESRTFEDELFRHGARTLRREISNRTLCSKMGSSNMAGASRPSHRSTRPPSQSQRHENHSSGHSVHTLRRVSATRNLCSKTISSDLANASRSVRRAQRSARPPPQSQGMEDTEPPRNSSTCCNLTMPLKIIPSRPMAGIDTEEAHLDTIKKLFCW